jgi:hypothetical protein
MIPNDDQLLPFTHHKFLFPFHVFWRMNACFFARRMPLTPTQVHLRRPYLRFRARRRTLRFQASSGQSLGRGRCPLDAQAHASPFDT